MNFKITTELVMKLIAEQFPQWADLPIRQVEPGGNDNKMFRLGKQMVVRLPSNQNYRAQVKKEQEWLPKIAPHLSVTIPKPLAQGAPSKSYLYEWSIYEWIEGDSIDKFYIYELSLQQIALQLAKFLNELHAIDTTDAPTSGMHNFHRGGDLSVYDAQTRAALDELKDEIDVEAATLCWQTALNSKWEKKPVWVHGDLSIANLIGQQLELGAVIDFGCMAVGDPACDLVIAWTFFEGSSREFFLSDLVGLDSQTEQRARGWALWKALILLVGQKDKTSPKALQEKYIIENIFSSKKVT